MRSVVDKIFRGKRSCIWSPIVISLLVYCALHWLNSKQNIIANDWFAIISESTVSFLATLAGFELAVFGILFSIGENKKVETLREAGLLNIVYKVFINSIVFTSVSAVMMLLILNYNTSLNFLWYANRFKDFSIIFAITGFIMFINVLSLFTKIINDKKS